MTIKASSMDEEKLVKKVEYLEKAYGRKMNLMETQDVTIGKLNKKVNDLNKVVFEIQNKLKQCKAICNDVDALVNKKRNRSHILQRSPRQLNEHTAFTVYIDGSKDLHNGETLIFNRALYNEGNAYNTANGIFNCKISGVYLFSMAFGVIDGNRAVLKIVIDGSNQVDGIAESRESFHDVQGGNTVITHVNAGQAVWVVQYFETDGIVRGDSNYRFTSFSGVLLY